MLRIAQEAVLNAVRHSGARSVRSTCGWRPTGRPGRARCGVDVVDDGRGLPAEPVAGVGLASMRERAAELGGG